MLYLATGKLMIGAYPAHSLSLTLREREREREKIFFFSVANRNCHTLEGILVIKIINSRGL